jgi:hypothetical protein
VINTLREDAVHDCLSKHAMTVSRVRTGQWDFTLSNGRALRGVASVKDDWLHVEMPLTTARGRRRRLNSARSAWGLLSRNKAIRGNARLILSGRERFLNVSADISLDDEVNLASRIEESLHGFATALEATCGPHGNASVDSRSTVPISEAAKGPDPDLRRLCEEAGWPFIERPTGSLAVDLGVPRDFYQGIVEEQEGRDGGIRLSVGLAQGELSPKLCRWAVAFFLLTACSALRMVRPATEGKEHESAVSLEISFASRPCAPELHHALAALSVACQMIGREAKVLHQDERLAREYLLIRGLSSRSR